MTDVPSVFIGVVSHTRSRFAHSQGPDGLAMRLARHLDELGLPTAVWVNTEDLWDPTRLPLDARTVQESLDAQRDMDTEWARYLSDVGHDERPITLRSLRWFRRLQYRARPPGVATVRRLVNIELSHLDLLQRGVASGASWLLVLEDDADSIDSDDCAQGLNGIMLEAPADLAFVNVSRSFTLKALGIDHLTSPAPATWRGSTERQILQADRPVTNTVCAILYRSSFAQTLLDEIRSRPMEPIVPIDWRLNDVLMRLNRSKRLGAGRCWVVDPGPITQMSMH